MGADEPRIKGRVRGGARRLGQKYRPDPQTRLNDSSRDPIRRRNGAAPVHVVRARCKERIMSGERGPIQRVGCHISGLVADFAANPVAQVGFVLLCLLWFWLGLSVNVLTAA